MPSSAEPDADLFLGLCEWSDPVPRNTRQGPRLLRTCHDIPKDFWSLWRDWKDEIKELGISCSRDDESGEFVLKWWVEADAPEAATRAQIQPVDIQPVLPGKWHLGRAGHLLRPHQVNAAATLMVAVQQFDFALSADDPGLGKTFEALAVVAELGMNFGIICPANVVTKWENTCLDPFGLVPEFVLSYDKLRSGKYDYVTRTDRPWRGKTRSHFRWNTIDDVILIWDEVHVCSASGSLNSLLLDAALANPHIKSIGLSATVAQSILNFTVLGKALRLHDGNWWDWALANGARPGVFGGLDFRGADKPGTKAFESLRKVHSHIFPRHGCRLRRSEIKGLPELEVCVELVDLVDRQDKAVADAIKRLDDKIAEDERRAEEKEQEVCAFVTTTRERQETEILKTPWMAEKTRELLSTGHSVVIFLNYTESINLAKHLLRDISHVQLVGGLSKQARDNAIAAFQENLVPLIICQSDAGSASIDLHDVHGGHPRATLLSPHYSAVKVIQALGRTPRDGAKSKSLAFMCFAAGTVEERAAELCQKKIDQISLLNDGDLSALRVK